MPRPKHMSVREAQRLDRIADAIEKNFRSDTARWYAGLRLAGYTESEADKIMSSGHRGEFKAAKTCAPRRKAKRKCHRAGQFKPGGGRYKTTPCKRR